MEKFRDHPGVNINKNNFGKLESIWIGCLRISFKLAIAFCLSIVCAIHVILNPFTWPLFLLFWIQIIFFDPLKQVIFVSITFFYFDLCKALYKDFCNGLKFGWYNSFNFWTHTVVKKNPYKIQTFLTLQTSSIWSNLILYELWLRYTILRRYIYLYRFVWDLFSNSSILCYHFVI